jgi:hypothetical protein
VLNLVLRRALGQYRLVAAVVALVTVAATLLGVCALLLGPTDDQAFARELQPSQPEDFDVDAFVVTVKADDLVEVRDTAADQLRDVLGSLDPEISVIETSPVRDLLGRGDNSVGYLAAGNGLAPRSELLTGRWPESTSGPTETTVHETAARLLGLSLGDRVRLGGNSGFQGFYDPITLVVVGTFRPQSDLGWESDLLTGDGVDPEYDDEGTEAAYGPFVVDDAAFLASESPAARLRVTARPDMARADRESAIAAATAYDGAGDKLVADLADRVTLTRVASRLPDTLDRIEAQRAAGRSIVLVAVLLGAALSLAALLLAGRLVAAVRDEERVLLVSFGASRRQQLAAAGCEAVLLALVAAGVALPAAALVHSWLTHLDGPSAAGLSLAPTIKGGLVLTVLGCTLVLAPVLVLTAVDLSTTAAATRRRWATARTGADWTLIGAAVVVVALSWWQLRGRPDTTSDRVDVTLTLAPVVCLVASILVVVRLVPVLLRAASGLALRSPGLVLPLSVQQAARRPHPGTALVLIAAAVAAATFGLGLRSTWERSQADQADLRVGTDLSLTLHTTPTEADAAAVLAAVDGRSAAVSAVIDQQVAIGRYVGTADAPPTLIAIDSDVGGDLLRGRLDDRTWGALTARLDPGPDVTGLPLSDADITIQGRTDGTLPIKATATAVVESATGLRQTVTAATVPLDGRAHPLTWSDRVDGLRLVALALHLDGRPPHGANEIAAADVDLTVTVPGDGGDGRGSEWYAQPRQGNLVDSPSVTVETAADGVRLRSSAVVDTGRLHDGGGDLLITSFAAPARVPVVLSDELADAIDAEIGDALEGNVGATPLPLEVVAVVPDVPSAPGRPAVLADVDTVSRGLIAGGQLEPVVDAFWVGQPTVQAELALGELGFGDVVTRAEVTDGLARGPFEIIVPTVLSTLVVAAVVLLLAGVVLVTGADQRRRAVELARLRALGLPRRGARRLLLAEHAAFLAPLMCLGTCVGVAASWVLAPLMVRSDLGAAPVPVAVADWPWAAAAAVLGGALLGSVLVTWMVVVRQVRASDRAGLRTGDS